MEIHKIVVTDLIMSGRLFTEEGYDLEQSADNLADIKGQIIMNFMQEHYPKVEVYADIAIQKEDQGNRPLEVMAYNEGGEIIRAASEAIAQQLSTLIADGIADGAWVVRVQ
ncbi:MAG: hypothetical protein PHI97_06075 [Desulfobulbus sp.]|nr:hypothetical protein [Desulfobulbus sp.]